MTIEDIKTQEAVLCERLRNDNRVSITTYSPNPFADIIFLNANKTNESLALQIDLVAKTIKFWNDCDESFTQSMDNQGIDCAIEILKNEFEQVYYFQPIGCAQVISYPVKMDGIVDADAIKKEAMKMRKYGNETFDCMKVHNFIGSKRYSIKFCDGEIFVEEKG